MKKLLFFFFLIISMRSFAQEDVLKYVHYRFQYGTRMDRGWFDKSFRVPVYGDTSDIETSVAAGRILVDTAGSNKGLYIYYDGYWHQAGMSSTFGGTDATASGNRSFNANGFTFQVYNAAGIDMITTGVAADIAISSSRDQLLDATRYITLHPGDSLKIDQPYSSATLGAYYPLVVSPTGGVMKYTGSFGGGSGTDNANAGSFYRWLIPGTQELKTAAVGYGILKDSTTNSNAITDKLDTATVFTKVRTFIPPNLASYGTIYNQGSFDASILSSDFTQWGTPTYSDSSGYVIIKGGTSTLANSLNLKKNSAAGITDYYTNIEDFTIKVSFIVRVAGIIGVGLQSTVSGSPTTMAVATLNTSSGSLTAINPSASNLSISLGDEIELIFRRNGQFVYAYARNITTSSATVTASGAYNFSGGTAFPTFGQFAIFNYSGWYAAHNLSVHSELSRNPSIVILGDSKTSGYTSTGFSRWGAGLNNYFPTNIMGGGLSTTVDWLRVVDDIIFQNPQAVFMTNPSNDLRTGINTDSTKNRYYRMERRFRDVGIHVYHINAFYETSTNTGTWATHINSTRSADSTIFMYEATQVPGFLDADLIHPTTFGQSIIVETITNAKNIAGVNMFSWLRATNRALAPVGFVANSINTIVAQEAAFHISGASRIANNLDIGSATSSQISFRNRTESDNNIRMFGSGGVNYIESANNARGAGTQLDIRGSGITLATNFGAVNALTLVSNGDATIPKHLVVGDGTQGGTVLLKLIPYTNNEINFYNASNNENYLRSTTSSNAAGRTFHIGGLNLLFEDITAGGTTTERMRVTASGVIINEDGLAINTRIEGDADQNLVLVDGTNDRVGIGTASPLNKLDINGDLRIRTITSTTAVDSILVQDAGIVKYVDFTNVGKIAYVSSGTTGTPTPVIASGAQLNYYLLSGLATNPTFAAPTGSPTFGYKLYIRISDNGAARTLSWNAIYRESTAIALPTTTTGSAGDYIYLEFQWNELDSKWDLVGRTDFDI